MPKKDGGQSYASSATLFHSTGCRRFGLGQAAVDNGGDIEARHLANGGHQVGAHFTRPNDTDPHRIAGFLAGRQVGGQPGGGNQRSLRKACVTHVFFALNWLPFGPYQKSPVLPLFFAQFTVFMRPYRGEQSAIGTRSGQNPIDRTRACRDGLPSQLTGSLIHVVTEFQNRL